MVKLKVMSIKTQLPVIVYTFYKVQSDCKGRYLYKWPVPCLSLSNLGFTSLTKYHNTEIRRETSNLFQENIERLFSKPASLKS